MALTALDEAREQPGLLIEMRGTISAATAADLLKAHNKAFRAWCRENSETPRDLVIVDSGTGSYWARLRDAAELYSLLDLASPLLPAFMTHLAHIMQLGFESDPTEFPALFTELLKSYRKAIGQKSVQAIVIAGLTIEPVQITSVRQVDMIVAAITVKRQPRKTPPPVTRQISHAELLWKLPPGHLGQGFKRHGTVRLIDGTTYVRLEGMDGTLLHAHGRHTPNLVDGWSYAFEGHMLTNDAQETIGYAIEQADPLPQLG